MSQAPVSSSVATRPAPPARMRGDLAALLFITLLGCYAYFWQSRDWNTATRLMLTYALGDRHQLEIDGLEGQASQSQYNPRTGRVEITAGDIAAHDGHYYTDKAPGQSLLGVGVYMIGKQLGLAEHPLDREAMAYWPADYFVTLGTSGLLTAALGVILYAFALRFGVSQRAGVLLGLAYGLGTPAFVYATLLYGHQAAAFCVATSFFLVYRAAHETRAVAWNLSLAGLLAGCSVVIEYQTIGIAAALGLYAMVAIRRLRPLVVFGVSGSLAVSLLAAYNYRAFGDPFELSYAHEVSREFRQIHSADNPLGLRLPAWDQALDIMRQLVWGRFRGLTFYAPVLLAAPLGVLLLAARRYGGVAAVVVAACGWMLLVNLSYPLWEGGWCTGPRFLLPAVPFGVLAVAALIGADRSGTLTSLLGLCTVASTVMMIACTAVGGRFPPVFTDPVVEVAWPHVAGNMQIGQTPIAGGRQFEWNAGRWLIERFDEAGRIPAEPSAWQALQLAPLCVFLAVMVGLLLVRSRGSVIGGR